jgi:hypothetical protein
MEREIYTNFSKPDSFDYVKNFLEELSKKWIFQKFNIEWETTSCISVKYILNNRSTEDSVEIFLIQEGKRTKVVIEGEKFFTVEYFFLELREIL